MSKPALKKFLALAGGTAILGFVLVVVGLTVHSALLRTVGLSFVLVMVLLMIVEAVRYRVRHRS